MSQIIPANNGLYFIEVDLPKMGFQVRGAVLVGKKRVLIWDTLTHPRDMQTPLSIYAGKPITVVYSHADWDHVWGTSMIPFNEIIAHTAAPERFAKDLPETLKKMRADHPGEWDGIKLIPPTITFNTSMSIDLGGVTIELHALPGHTKDSIVGFIPEFGVLLAGDALEDPLPMINAPSDIPRWINKLKDWEKDPRLETVVPAHGAVSGRLLIEQNVSYLEKLACGSTVVTKQLSGFYAEAHQENLKKAAHSNRIENNG